jgi:glycosyltransferase involved in cell wall biosynthesis
MALMKYSIIIPVYKNEDSIAPLINMLDGLNNQLKESIEVVFVVDGSPDNSFALLNAALDDLNFPAQILVHSRNFGSFPAIRSGLSAASGKYFGVMAADLQEPPELMIEFFSALSNDECDVAIGTRSTRSDPRLSRVASEVFWKIYKRLVVNDMPEGGVDVFGCNRNFRDQLLLLHESRSSLIAQIFWLGYRRKLVSYDRLSRQQGKSSWTLNKKIEYMMDSIFAFTDFPVRLLIRFGAVGLLLSSLGTVIVIIARISGAIDVPGYAATMIAVLFFGALNLFGIGLVGEYAWRGYENSKNRPLAVVAHSRRNY